MTTHPNIASTWQHGHNHESMHLRAHLGLICFSRTVRKMDTRNALFFWPSWVVWCHCRVVLFFILNQKDAIYFPPGSINMQQTRMEATRYFLTIIGCCLEQLFLMIAPIQMLTCLVFLLCKHNQAFVSNYFTCENYNQSLQIANRFSATMHEDLISPDCN